MDSQTQYEEKFTVPSNVNARVLKVWEQHARRQITRWIKNEDNFQEWIMSNVMTKSENPPGPFTRFLYWFALSCQTGWGVMVDFNEYSQRIFLVDKYYKWMHKLRDELNTVDDKKNV